MFAGGAVGLTVDSLLKLKDTKAPSQPRMTLLHAFVADAERPPSAPEKAHLTARREQALDLLEDIDRIQVGSKYPYDQIETEQLALVKAQKRIQLLARNAEEYDGDNLKTVAVCCAAEMEMTCEEITSEMQQAESVIMSSLQLFAEADAKSKQYEIKTGDVLLNKLLSLYKDIEMCKAQLKEWKEKEEKERQKKERATAKAAHAAAKLAAKQEAERAAAAGAMLGSAIRRNLAVRRWRNRAMTKVREIFVPDEDKSLMENFQTELALVKVEVKDKGELNRTVTTSRYQLKARALVQLRTTLELLVEQWGSSTEQLRSEFQALDLDLEEPTGKVDQTGFVMCLEQHCLEMKPEHIRDAFLALDDQDEGFIDYEDFCNSFIVAVEPEPLPLDDNALLSEGAHNTNVDMDDSDDGSEETHENSAGLRFELNMLNGDPTGIGDGEFAVLFGMSKAEYKKLSVFRLPKMIASAQSKLRVEVVTQKQRHQKRKLEKRLQNMAEAHEARVAKLEGAWEDRWSGTTVQMIRRNAGKRMLVTCLACWIAERETRGRVKAFVRRRNVRSVARVFAELAWITSWLRRCRTQIHRTTLDSSVQSISYTMRQRMLVLFDSMDTEETGSVDRAHFKQGLKRLALGFSAQEIDTLANLSDPERSGTVNYADFLNVLADRSHLACRGASSSFLTIIKVQLHGTRTTFSWPT